MEMKTRVEEGHAVSVNIQISGTLQEVQETVQRMLAAVKAEVSKEAGTDQLTAISERFHRYVGRHKSLDMSVRKLLQGGGKATLAELVEASGVAQQRHYSGIGSSLSRNMIKAGGPRKWYSKRYGSKAGQIVYEVEPYLVSSLRKAWGLN